VRRHAGNLVTPAPPRQGPCPWESKSCLPARGRRRSHAKWSGNGPPACRGRERAAIEEWLPTECGDRRDHVECECYPAGTTTFVGTDDRETRQRQRPVSRPGRP